MEIVEMEGTKMVDASPEVLVSEIFDQLKNYSRKPDILDHEFKLQTKWWKEELATAGWESHGKLAADGPSDVKISRSDLFAMATGVHNSEAHVEDFAFNVLLWGSGESRRNNRARIHSIVDKNAGAELMQALELSRSDAMASFNAFKPKRRNAFKFLGPAFFTKLMYFYGTGSPEHKPLIVDLRVLRSLSRTTAGKGIYVGHNYGVNTYAKAMAALENIADSARTTGDEELAACTPDLVERWAFDRGGVPK
jgi:hypothetical protein